MARLAGGRAKVVASGVTLLVLAGAGGALAAAGGASPSTQNQAIISDAASQVSVSASALSAALIKAIDDQINAAVTAGKISQKQATALEARVASGDVPLFNVFGPGLGGGPGGPGGPGAGMGGPLGGPGGAPAAGGKGGPVGGFGHRHRRHAPPGTFGPSGPSGASGASGASGTTTTTTTTTTTG